MLGSVKGVGVWQDLPIPGFGKKAGGLGEDQIWEKRKSLFRQEESINCGVRTSVLSSSRGLTVC